MKQLLVSVKDNAVQAFQPIATVRAEGEALRSFMDAVNNPDNRQLHQHPEDFDLYLVGYFDDQTGRLELLEDPRQLTRGISVKNVKG